MNYRRILLGVLATLMLCTPAMASSTVYTNVGDFLAAIQGDFYLEDFGSVGFGDPGNPVNFGPVNGYEFEITAGNGLFSGGGNMSTNTAFDPMVITTTGNPTAVGGNFWLTDFDFLTEVGQLQVDFADGSSTSETLTNADPTTFLGVVSNNGTPITGVTLTPVDPGDGINRWATVDNVYLGSAVPEPSAFGLVAMSLLSLLAMRRR